MIQRIQTVFLAVAALFNLITYFTPLYSRAVEDPQAWIGIGLALTLLLATGFSMFSIFRYADRKDQVRWVKTGMLFQVFALGFGAGILFSLGGIGTYLWDEGIGLGLIIVALILQKLAERFIRKDVELVRSMDRIR